MTDFYAQLTQKTGFNEALVCHALNFSRKIDINEFSRLFFDTECFSVEKSGVLYFKEAFYPFEFYNKLLEISLVPEISSLYIYICLLEKSFCDFSRRIEDTSIFFETAKKLVESSKKYYENTGKYGIYDYRFVANHVRSSIIRIGGFEYQYGSYNGKRVIFLHLPENTDLSQDGRFKSYSLARQYFGEYPIVADSWVLYPEHKKMLSKDSRILDFMNDFDIVSSSETYDYSETFHIFGRLTDFSYENLPKNTSLQRAYAEWIKNGHPIGSGVGILKY